MSGAPMLLVILGRDGGFEGWLRLDGGTVAERGAGLEGLPPLIVEETGEPLHVVAVVPGEDVAVHWLEIPANLAPAQAAAAARLMAAELSAAPAADLHVAVGPEREVSPLRCVAIASAGAMAGWVARCQSVGIDPQLVLPAPLLLLPPEDGLVRFLWGGIPLYRGAEEAFSLEPELAALIQTESVREINATAFEAGLAEAIGDAPVNLRQGAFARRRRWKVDWKLVRRLAMLVAAILMVSFAVQLTLALRHTFAADRLEAEADRVAASAVPDGSRLADPQAQLARHASEEDAPRFSAAASLLFAAVRDTPNAELTALAYDRNGALRATVAGDTSATVGALRQRLETGGGTAEAGPLRNENGRHVAEVVLGVR